jgi:prolipoprotein diacylglyceryltransferase
MRPYLIDALSDLLGSKAAHLLAPSYFTMAAIAALLGAILAIRRARREKLDVAAVIDAILGAYVGAVAGGIVFPIILDLAAQLFAGRTPRLRWAGMVAYGGFLFGVLGAYVALRRRGTVSIGAFLDLVAAPVGLAIAIVRLGCFVAGCDYGEVTSLPCAIRFPAGSPAWHDHVRAGLVPSWRGESLPVHPSQLYEALLGVAIFVGATLAARRPRRPTLPGERFVAVMVAYAVGRFALESLRGDVSRGLAFGLSTSQVIGLIVVAGAIGWIVLRRRRAAALGLTTALVILTLAGPGWAQQPAPPAPPPPEPEPLDPYAPQDPGQPAPAPTPPPAPPQPPPPVSRPMAPPATTLAVSATPHRYDAGFALAATSAMNRSSGQVPTLYGAVVTFLIRAGNGLLVGADAEATTSNVAIHRSLLGVIAHRSMLGRQWMLDIRAAIGGTQIDFIDPSFVNVLTLDFRIGGGFAYIISPSVVLLIQPLVIDFVSSRDLGGPLVSWQGRMGVAFSWGR